MSSPVYRRGKGNFSIFLYFEKDRQVLYTVRKLEHFAVFFVYKNNRANRV